MSDESTPEYSFPIRAEQLDIHQDKHQIGHVTWHIEVQTEEKSFRVPIKHEYLVIEKAIPDQKNPETIRIHLREERVEFNKQTYDLEQVKIYKQTVPTIEDVDVTLKKERFYAEED